MYQKLGKVKQSGNDRSLVQFAVLLGLAEISLSFRIGSDRSMPMEVRVKPQPRFSLKRVWRFCGIPLLIIGVVVGLVRGGYTLREWQGQRKLSQAIVDLERSGIATKPAATEVV